MIPNFGRHPWTRDMKVLDFDIENRPLAYWYDDKTTPEITAIAWAWYDQMRDSRTQMRRTPVLIHVRHLNPPPLHHSSAMTMLGDFRQAWDEADMVTGHYIRKHDIPVINAALIEYGLPPLTPKLVSDTKLDLVTYGGQPASQKALSNTLEVQAPKKDMPVAKWRDANRLTEEGIEAAKARVTSDVRQHMELRAVLIEEGLLKPPVVWSP